MTDGDPPAILQAIYRLRGAIISRPRLIVLGFLLLTAGFGAGLGDIEQAQGFDTFVEGVPAQEAQDAIDEEFEASGETTQVILRDENVLTKSALLELARVLEQFETRDRYQVESSSSIAWIVAEQLDPSATTPTELRQAIERAPPAEVEAAVRDLIERPGVQTFLSDDRSTEEPFAAATFATVAHDETVDAETVQLEMRTVADDFRGEFIVFGGGILDAELETVIADSLALVVPVVLLLILGFLIVAYRDPIDLALGLVALVMTIVWTFGFMGLSGIPFSEMMIAVPPLLLAIGVDFGIHTVNRYREERITGQAQIPSMTAAADQLLVAFFIVTGTTVIGFGANVISDLEPIRDFGIVASIGIVFTFLIFGIFLPAAKLEVDRLRERFGVPAFSESPIGGGGETPLGQLLTGGARVGRRAPQLILVVVLLLTVAAGGYATTVDTTFAEEDFLPPEELPAYVEAAPGPLTPGEYTATESINFIEDTFETTDDDEITIYLEGSLREDHTLAALARAGEDPPETVVTGRGVAERDSIIDVMQDLAEEDEEYARLFAASDLTGDGIPDRNAEPLLQGVLDSEFGTQASRFVTEDLSSTRVIYTVEAEATQSEVAADATALAGDHRLAATPTGELVVFDQVTTMILESSLQSLGIALLLTAVFLMLVYVLLEGRLWLGVANLVPIVVTVALLGATMAAIGLPLNALTGTVLSITIGVGIAYSVHVTHRFIDEYNERSDGYESLLVTLSGTGGALTGSMITTLGGAGSLILAITPLLGQFGLLMVISVLYSYLTAIVVLPPTLLVWERYAA